MNDKVAITDESNDRKYFTIIPNYIGNHSTANDQALYFQIKKHCGESGICFVSKRTLMKKLGIGIHALNKSFKYLTEHGWIEKTGTKKVQTEGGPQTVDVYKTADIWELNFDHYDSKPKGCESSNTLTKGASSLDEGASNLTQRGANLATKEDPGNKEEPKKNNIYRGSAKKPTSHTQEFLKYFGELWSLRVGEGKAYHCNFGKEGKLAKNLLKTFSFKELCELAVAFFDSDSEWLEDKGYTIGVFVTQINRLNAQKETGADAWLQKKLAEKEAVV